MVIRKDCYRRILNQMLGKNFRKITTSFTAAAVLCVYSMVGLAATKDLTGEISVVGQVSVNGQTAVSNSTIISGSTIVTGADSSAIISLGKTGRIEVLANSNIVLNFSDTNIVGILSSGKARVANAAGVATTITTKDATVIADAAQADNFTVEVECSHTHVDTTVLCPIGLDPDDLLDIRHAHAGQRDREARGLCLDVFQCDFGHRSSKASTRDLPWVSDTNSRKNTHSDRTESVSRATKPDREATESQEPRPDSRPASRFAARLQSQMLKERFPSGGGMRSRIVVPKDREGFGH
jgi:hypothetical protein